MTWIIGLIFHNHIHNYTSQSETLDRFVYFLNSTSIDFFHIYCFDEFLLCFTKNYVDKNIYNRVIWKHINFQIVDVCLVGDIISCKLVSLSHDTKRKWCLGTRLSSTLMHSILLHLLIFGRLLVTHRFNAVMGIE